MANSSKREKPKPAGSATNDNLTPQQMEILVDVMAQHPKLTRDEALEALREAGL